MHSRLPFAKLLIGPRVQLIPVCSTDASAIEELLANEQVLRYITSGGSFRFNRARRIASELLAPSDERNVHYGIFYADHSELVGVASLQNYNRNQKTATIGYVLHPSYWGLGIATEALGVLLRYAFQELAVLRVEGHCHEGNLASEKVMLRSGMRLEKQFVQKRLFVPSQVMKVYVVTPAEFL